RERSDARLEPESSSNAVLIAEAAVFEVQLTIGSKGGTGLGLIIPGCAEEGRIEGRHAKLLAGTVCKAEAVR
ncbi:MAG: hypothetical protein EZS28_047889, partial [Streblomastix strix]